jgi:hypothetical protein
MREEVAALTLFVLGGALALLAAGATHDLGIATALASGAVALAGVGLVVILAPVVGRSHWVDVPIVGAPLVLLRESFQSGPMGRQAIVSTVASLEQSRTGGTQARMSPDEERRLVMADPAEFRAWLEAHLERLERET